MAPGVFIASIHCKMCWETRSRKTVMGTSQSASRIFTRYDNKDNNYQLLLLFNYITE